LEEWEEYTKYNSNIKQDSVRKDYLRRRLVNLVDRKYAKRDGNTYSITDRGRSYLQLVEQTNPNDTVNKETQLIRNIEHSIKNKGLC
jgi:restriction system protein